MAVRKITKAISKEVEDKNTQEQQSISQAKEQADEKNESVNKIEELQKLVEDLCGKILDFSIERMDNLLNKKTGLNFADKLLNKI